MSNEDVRNINKKEMIRALYERMERKLTLHECEEVVENILHIVAEGLEKGGSIKLPPIGSLHVKKSAPRLWKNPEVQKVMITPKPTVRLKVSAEFRNTLAEELK